MKMITGTGKNKLKANNFPVHNHGNSSKATTLKDNEDVSASQNFRNNGKHFYMKKNKKTIEQETTTTTVMQEGNGQQKMSITVKKKEVIEITCSICCTDNNDNISWAVIKSCNHIFHSECIQKWIDIRQIQGKSLTYPLCLKKFRANEVEDGITKEQYEKDDRYRFNTSMSDRIASAYEPFPVGMNVY